MLLSKRGKKEKTCKEERETEEGEVRRLGPVLGSTRKDYYSILLGQILVPGGGGGEAGGERGKPKPGKAVRGGW